MERVAFLVEHSNQRLGCLLNPESLLLRRTAGVKPVATGSGRLTGAGLADDPVLYTGGGRTELTVDLLFDVNIPGSSVGSDDVRDLTGPLWSLAENSSARDGSDAGSRWAQPSLVRFIWGKSWNMPGIVVAVAERLEHFTPAGVPQRAWLSLRMFRLDEEPVNARGPGRSRTFPLEGLEMPANVPEGGIQIHSVLGAATDVAVSSAPSSPLALGAQMTIQEAFTTAGQIVSAALSETPAGQMLAAARNAVAGVISDVGDTLSRIPGQIAGSAAGLALQEALGRIGEAISTLASAAATDVVAVTARVTGAIAAAASAAGQALDQMSGTVGDEIRSRIRAALDQVRPAVETMAQATGIVAGAVRARAQDALAAAVVRMEFAARTTGDALTSLMEAGSESVREAGERIQAAVARVQEALSQSRAHGRLFDEDLVPAALTQIGEGLDALGRAGHTAAVSSLQKGQDALALAWQSASAATGALASVGPGPGVDAVAAATGQVGETVTAARNATEVEKARTALGELTNQIQALDATTSALPAESNAESNARLETALTVIRSAQERLQADTGQTAEETVSEEQRTLLDEIDAALSEVEAAASSVHADEEEKVAQLIHVALTEPESIYESPLSGAEGRPATGEDEPDREPDEQTEALEQGERLDQIAYRYYGDPAYWRLLARFNQIDEPLRLPAGRPLRIPPQSAFSSGRPPGGAW